MKLKVKLINIKAGGPQIAILNEHDALQLDVKEGDRIELQKGKNKTTAVLDIAYNKDIKDGQLGLYQEVAEKIKTKNNDSVNVKVSLRPKSVQYIKDKLDRKPLNQHQVDSIIKDLLANKLSQVELTYFIAACYTNGMTIKESAFLSKAIVKHGQTIKFKKTKIVDKHCIGGIPGNRTTMIVVPILAAAGLIIPKTSTRSITSASGTADTMEVLAPVIHHKKKIKKIVNKIGGCMVWGGALEIASADDQLIKLERPLNLDPEGVLIASILSKKVAVNSKYVLIDIPVGPQAKINTYKHAKTLKTKFLKMSRLLKLKTKVIITKGLEPIGNGIGPALEAKDVLLTLQNKGPKDLKNKSIYLASLIMNMAGIKFPKRKARKLLESGKAYEKMVEIIKAQGGKITKPAQIKIGPLKRELRSKTSATIKHIDIKELARIAKIAGAPKDKEAGLYIHVKLKDKIKKNQPLITIYSQHEYKLEAATKAYKEETLLAR